MTNSPAEGYCGVSLKPLQRSRKHPGYNNAPYQQLFGTTSVTPELPFTRNQFFTEGVQYAAGMSISGVQQKLSLVIDRQALVYTSQAGKFILKPSPESFPHAAENEHAAMMLARAVGFDTAHCGLIRFHDSSEYAYLTRRYDRAEGARLHQESLLSAAGLASDNKYNISYEASARVVDAVAGGRKAMVLEFIRRVIYAYYIGNRDAHAMNFSFLRPKLPGAEPTVALAPIYDVLFTHVFPSDSRLSFLALPLLEDADGDEYFTEDFEHLGFYSLADFIELGRRVGVPDKPIRRFAAKLTSGLEQHIELINRSFMPESMQHAVVELLRDRAIALRNR